MAIKLSPVDPVRVIIALIFVLFLALFFWYVSYLRNKAANFDNVAAKLETTEESAEISREAGEAASRSNQEYQHEVFEDRRVVADARRPDADAAAHARLQDRINEAYARGLCAESRLQRAHCGPVVPAAPDE